VSRDYRSDGVRLSVGVTEDPNVLQGGDIREGQLLDIFKAVSEVFPSDSFPFDGFEQYSIVRRALEEVDTQLRSQSGLFSNIELRAERDRLYGRVLQFFKADLRLSRKQKLARMALTRDWSEIPSYIREGIVIWKYRILLRSGTLLPRVGLPALNNAYETSMAGQMKALLTVPPLVSSRKPVGDSGLTSSLERLGVAIVRAPRPEAITSGSLGLDEALGVGGFPLGRIVEIFGKEGSGKTTLALTAAGNAQRVGRVAWLDAECKLHLPWARVNGLNVDETLLLQGNRAAEIMSSILHLVRSGDFALVVLDSLAALFPDNDLEQYDADVATERARLLDRALPRIASAASKTQTCVLFLNQVRRDEDDIARKMISTGGHALAHYSSIRLELSRRMSQKNSDNTIIGYGVKGTIVKSCVGPPYRVAEWNINFERGLDLEFGLIEQALRRSVVSREARGLKFRDEYLGLGMTEASEFLLHRPEIAALISDSLKQR
jgi:recombination protein RecA